MNVHFGDVQHIGDGYDMGITITGDRLNGPEFINVHRRGRNGEIQLDNMMDFLRNLQDIFPRGNIAQLARQLIADIKDRFRDYDFAYQQDHPEEVKDSTADKDEIPMTEKEGEGKSGGYTNRQRQSDRQRQVAQDERDIRMERMRDEILEMIRLAGIEHHLDEDELQQLHEEFYENAGNTIEQIHATIRRLDRHLQGFDEERQGDGRFPYEERIDLSIGNLL